MPYLRKCCSPPQPTENCTEFSSGKAVQLHDFSKSQRKLMAALNCQVLGTFTACGSLDQQPGDGSGDWQEGLEVAGGRWAGLGQRLGSRA